MYQINVTSVEESTARTIRETYANKGCALAAFSLMSKYVTSTLFRFTTISLYEDGDLIRHYDSRVGFTIDMED